MSINSEDRPWPQVLDHDGVDWPSDEQRVLVPFCEAANRTETSRLGASIAFGSDGELYLLHAIAGGDSVNGDELRHEAELELELREEFSVPVTQFESEFSKGVLDSFVDAHSITATVVDREEREFFARGRDEQTVASGCHTVVGTRMDDFESPSSILVPVAKGPHSGLATRIAEAIARATGCWIEVFHVVGEDATEQEKGDADALLDAYEHRLGDDVDVDHHVVEAAEPADEIIEHASYHDVTVLGAPEKGRLRRFLFGSTTDDVERDGESGPVLTVHRDTDESVLSRWV
ncbi:MULTISPECIES: universal stress protein [Halobacterium]|uniref:universal stress protein n=1 Tax=Halobacterium TaxID=2239 RepID=UPI00073EA8F7|nr:MULTISPECIES: universal stress protein [Halobacterium]MCG1002914.1 universal stress protein [Halobacterium noricense]